MPSEQCKHFGCSAVTGCTLPVEFDQAAPAKVLLQVEALINLSAIDQILERAQR
jgi:hypothetical protein